MSSIAAASSAPSPYQHPMANLNNRERPNRSTTPLDGQRDIQPAPIQQSGSPQQTGQTQQPGKNVWSKLLDETCGAAAKAAPAAGKKATEKLVEVAPSYWDKFMKTGLGESLNKGITAMGDALKNGTKGVSDLLGRGLRAVGNAFGGFLKKGADLVGKASPAVAKLLKGGASALGDVFKTVSSKIGWLLSTLVDNPITRFVSNVPGLNKVASNFSKSVGGVGGPLGAAMGGALGAALEGQGSQSTLHYASRILGGAAGGAVGDIVGGVAGSIIGPISAAVGSVGGAAGGAYLGADLGGTIADEIENRSNTPEHAIG